MQVGILGGTGPAGSALAARLASSGMEVVVGSRARERAADTCEGLRAAWPGRDLGLEAGDNHEAASADVVVVATPWDAAGVTTASLAAELAGKVVVSMANALVRAGGQFQALALPRGSVAADVQAAAPEALVATAFQHVPARLLGDLDRELEADVLICSDHSSATEAAAALIAKVARLRPLDAGRLSSAAAVESLTAVLLQLNARYRAKTTLKVLGLPG